MSILSRIERWTEAVRELTRKRNMARSQSWRTRFHRQLVHADTMLRRADRDRQRSEYADVYGTQRKPKPQIEERYRLDPGWSDDGWLDAGDEWEITADYDPE